MIRPNSLAGTGNIRDDKAVLPDIFFFSGGYKDGPRNLGENTLVADLLEA